MFDNFCISDFDKDEALIYIRALISVAKSDNYLHDAEEEYIKLQAEMLDLDIEPLLRMDNNDISFLISTQMSHTHRIVLLRDCIILSCLDGDNHKLERMKIIEIASKLDLYESDIEEIESWRNSILEVL